MELATTLEVVGGPLESTVALRSWEIEPMVAPTWFPVVAMFWTGGAVAAGFARKFDFSCWSMVPRFLARFAVSEPSFFGTSSDLVWFAAEKKLPASGF